MSGVVFVCLAAALAYASVASSGTATPTAGAASRVEASSPSASEGTAFPLRPATGGRYLVDAQGKPFLLTGDAAWSLVAQLTVVEADRYLEDRRRKGFNAILVNLLEREYAASAPRNAYGEAPFLGGSFSRPNARYFAHVDVVIRKARAKGLLVLLAPAYLGWEGGGDGWWSKMKAAGEDKLRDYGRYLGKRYRGFANVMWVNGGDFDPPREQKELVSAVAEGIRDVDTKLQTFHGKIGTSALGYWGSKSDWVDVNTIYPDISNVGAHSRSEYRRSKKPFFMIEGKYENEWGVEGAGVRAQAYQAVLAGAFGSVMGNNPIWLFGTGWERALNSPGSVGMGRLAALFRPLRWWLLRPDDRHSLLVDGAHGDADEAVAARAANGSFAVVYVPTSRTLTLDLTRMRGPTVAARWYDPLSGEFRAVNGSPFRASGRQKLRTPSKNSGGDSDVVLLLASARR